MLGFVSSSTYCVTTQRQNVPYEKKKEHIVKITLLSPQSKMYRKRGIFSKSLRYAPLTLTTLAALVPEELNAEIRIIDEGVEDLNIDAIDADLVGIDGVNVEIFYPFIDDTNLGIQLLWHKGC